MKSTILPNFGRLTAVALLMIMMPIIAKADVDINETNFPDENFRAWLLEQEYGKDGVLTDKEIEGIKTIAIGINTQNLKGIEFFPNLEELWCDRNQLTTLDLSKNTKLHIVGCSNNQLTSIDLSGLTELKKLECHANQLSSLDVSGCTALTELYCDWNNKPLKALNLSGCTSLAYLSFTGSQLTTSLDISGCTSLVKLYCSTNKLTSLDVSGCTALTELYCDWNKNLKTLNISGCTALAYLQCNQCNLTTLDASGCSALGKIDCKINQLTSLNVSGCAKLTEVSCYHNQIKGAAMDTFVESLPMVNNGRIEIISRTYEGEMNEMTTTQVKVANSKGWEILQNTVLGWQKYEGVDLDASVVINKESFPDENFCAYLQEQDYGRDGLLTNDEIQSITFMDVSNKNIQNLKGIEFFTALETLRFSNNQVTSIDLSNNSSLIQLDCGNNQLIELDVSKLTNLISLVCESNQLTELDVSGLTNLTVLNCNNNQLLELDVPKLINLISLFCGGNQLTKLDVSKLTNLTRLDCGVNQLTSLDISALTLLTHLNCSYNQLTSLDFSKLRNLTELRCDENRLESIDLSVCKRMKTLFCSENNLTSLDLSSLSLLTELFCNNNPIKSLDLSPCPGLTNLGCGHTELTSLDLSPCPKLKGLSFNNSSLTEIDLSPCPELTQIVCWKGQLTSLDVSPCKMLEELQCQVNQLKTLDLSKNTKLRKLDCSSNLLVSLNVTGCTELTEIHCYQNHIKGAEMDALVESLPIVNNRNMYVVYDEDEHNVITTDQVKVAKAKGWLPHYCSYGLWVGYLDIDPDVTGVQINEENFPDPVFRNWLAGQEYGKDRILTNDEIQNITIMEVSNINIQNLKGVEFFTELECLYCGANSLSELDLSKNSKLKICYCEYNQLKSLDVSHNIQLEHLNCGNNPLGSIDITKNTKLMSLECYSNKLTELDLSQNTELTSINCDTNPLKEIDLSRNTALTDLKCRSTGLKALDVSMCTKLTQLFCGYNAIKALDVSKCTELTWLDCKYNKIWELDLSKNTKLMTLDCLYNRLIGEGMDALIESLPMRTNEEGAEIHVYQELEDQVQNWMTTVQVAAAKAKGWKPMRSDDGFTWVEEYEGTPPAVGISINKKKFPDENFFYYVIENLPCGNDGVLTNQEIANIKVISCTGLDIKRLKGIEYFTAITTLLCYLNKIKGAAMDELIRCLPITDYAKMNVIWGDEDENVMTTTQVAAAKAKGWTPLYRDIDKIAWQAYEGSEPDLDPIVIAEETTVNPSEDAGPGKATTTESGVTTSLGAEDEVNAGEGSVTMVSSMTTNEVEELVENSQPTTSTFAETFKGFYFMLAAGKGRVEFDIETMGGYSLGVMIGSKFVGLYNKSIKGTVTIPYDIMENTWFFAYPTVSTANVRAHRASSTDGALKVYSLRIIPEDTYDPDGIGSIDNGQLIIDNSTSVYDLSGRKIDSSFFTLHSSFKRKGIYIIRMKDESSRKVLIK